jgi:hypothetical protein
MRGRTVLASVDTRRLETNPIRFVPRGKCAENAVTNPTESLNAAAGWNLHNVWNEPVGLAK